MIIDSHINYELSDDSCNIKRTCLLCGSKVELIVNKNELINKNFFIKKVRIFSLRGKICRHFKIDFVKSVDFVRHALISSVN